MPFADLSWAFSTIAPMKLFGKTSHPELEHDTLQLDWTSSKADPQQFGLSHLLYVTARHRSPPGLCAQPPSVHAECTPSHQENSLAKYADDTAIIGCITSNAWTAA